MTGSINNKEKCRLRVMLIHPYAVNMGGVDSVLLQLIEALEDLPIEFFVVIPHGSHYEQEYRKLGASVIPLQISVFSKGDSPATILRNMIMLVSSVLRVAKVIRHQNIDIVHSHKINSFVGPLSGRIAGIPSVHTIHEIKTGPIWMYRIFSWIIYRASCVIIILCDASRELFPAHIRSSPKIHKIHNGIDLSNYSADKHDPFESRNSLGLSQDAIVVSAISRIAPTKGIDTFILAAKEVLSEMSQVIFLMVGDVSEDDPQLLAHKEYLASLVGRLGIQNNFIFTGFRKDVKEILALSDIFVLPSHFDILPTSLLEAMAMGKPVVASDVGGVPEIVVDGVNGHLVESANPNELATAIMDLIVDRGLRKQMGVAGRMHVIEFFNVEIYASSTLSVYLDLIKATPLLRESMRKHTANRRD